jgi:hypothetical protein
MSVKLALTDFVNNPNLALEHDSSACYLCVRDNISIFVSDISLLAKPDHTMPPNCKEGCLYVDDVVNKVCVPIDKLDEIYEIKS